MSIVIHLTTIENKTFSTVFKSSQNEFEIKKKNANKTDLLHITESAVSSARGSGTGKVHAALAKLGVKRVVLGNLNGDTLAVSVVFHRQKIPVVRATRDW